ncbi:proton myo-inositol cotransporter-like [Tachypleus tridentatus]|uniref:proton myo-inositol cotransporter-like n=1 Tax=Tachypleus tridentatus TaxID=6853 RepID=UPI003FD0342C
MPTHVINEEIKNLVAKDNGNHLNLPTYMYLLTLLSAIGGFLFGYDTGVVSGAMILLRDYFSLNHVWQELIVSITIGGAWAFSLVAGILSDKLGRKPVILIASVVFTAGAIVMGFSVTREMLLVGRLTVGIGIGLSSMIVPMYIGEVAPSGRRGTLVTLNTCFVTGGQLIASIIAGAFSNDKKSGWRYMLGLAGIPSFIQFCGFLFMPESPRWLVKMKKYEKAIEVLRSVRGNSVDVEPEFQSIKNSSLEQERQQAGLGSKPVLFKILLDPFVRNALIVGCALQIFQQISGINTVMYYSATIIEMSGIKNETTVIWLAAVTAGVNFICTFIGLALVERCGRRPLVLSSLGGVTASLCLFAIGFHLIDAYSPSLDYRDPVVNGSICYTFNSCSECIDSGKCGYCFMDLSSGPANGTCLVADPDKINVALMGSCNSTSLPDPLTWAVNWCPSNYTWVIFLSLVLYLFFFAFGLGPMPWTINAEIYPLWARSTCYSTSTSMNWFFNMLISMSFLTFTEALTRYGTFWMYAIFAFIGWIYFMLVLPETKGRNLEDVESLFVSPWKRWKVLNHKESVTYARIHSFYHSSSSEVD